MLVRRSPDSDAAGKKKPRYAFTDNNTDNHHRPTQSAVYLEISRTMATTTPDADRQQHASQGAAGPHNILVLTA